MGSCLDPPLPPPLYLYRGRGNLCDPSHDHGDHLLPFHPVQSRKKPSSHTGPGSLSHPHRFTSFSFRCFFPTLLFGRPLDSLSGATPPSGPKTRGDSPSSKNLMEGKYPEIYHALSSRHRSGHFGDSTFCCPPFQPVLPHWIFHQSFHHPLGRVSHCPSQPPCLPLLLFLSPLCHPIDTYQ